MKTVGFFKNFFYDGVPFNLACGRESVASNALLYKTHCDKTKAISVSQLDAPTVAQANQGKINQILSDNYNFFVGTRYAFFGCMLRLAQNLTLILIQSFSLAARANDRDFDSHQICTKGGDCLEVDIDTKFSKDKINVLIHDFTWMVNVSDQPAIGSAFHRQIFGGPVSGETYLVYLKSHVKQIFKPKRQSRIPAFAFVEDGNLYISPDYFETFEGLDDDQTIFRTSILVHEIRHLEPELFEHGKCKQSFARDFSPQFSPTDRLPREEDMDSQKTKAKGKKISYRSMYEYDICDKEPLWGYGTQLIYILNLYRQKSIRRRASNHFSKIDRAPKNVCCWNNIRHPKRVRSRLKHRFNSSNGREIIMKRSVLSRIGLIALAVLVSQTQSSLGSTLLSPSGNNDLVELPLFDVLGDSNTLSAAEIKSFKAQRKKIENAQGVVCSEQSKPFVKKEDANLHSGFPMVAPLPVLEDQLATRFLREKSSGKFFAFKWAGETFPLATFHLTLESKEYFAAVQNAFNFINARATLHGLTKPGQNLIDLSTELVDRTQNSCNVNLIHVDKTFHNSSGATFPTVLNEDASRLGQIIDADIIFGNPNELYPVAHKTKMPFSIIADEIAYQKLQFERLIVHEVLHAMGVGHNFAFGSIMDYQGRDYVIRKTFSENVFDRGLEYEMDVLKFLYAKEYSPNKIWPPVRSTNKNTIWPIDPDRRWTGIENYEAIVDFNQSEWTCLASGKTTVLTSKIPPTFPVQTRMKAPKTKIVPLAFVDVGNFEARFYTVLPGNDFTVSGTFYRFLPLMNLNDEPVTYINSKFSGTVVNKLTKLSFPSVFSDAFNSDEMSSIDWTYRPDMSSRMCHIKINFKLQPSAAVIFEK